MTSPRSAGREALVVDPYEWLGVPKNQRPPTHYQLLGVGADADEPAVEAAANRRFTLLADHQTGPHAASAGRLAAEVAEARDTLLDPERRHLYDILAPDPDAPPPPVITADDAAAGPAPLPLPANPSQPWWTNAAPEESPLANRDWWKAPPPQEPVVPPPLPAPPPARVATDDSVAVAEPPGRARPVPIPLIAGGLAVVLILASGGFYLLRKPKEAGTPPDDRSAVATAGAAKGRKPQAGTAAAPAPEKSLPPVVNPPAAVRPPAVPEKKAVPDDDGPRKFRGHLSAVMGVAAGPGRTFYTIGDDKVLRLWAGGGSTILHTFLSPGVGIAAYDEGRRVAAADGLTVLLIDPAKPADRKAFDSPRGGVRAAAVSPDGRSVVTGLSDGFLRVWAAETGKFDEWQVAKGAVRALALTADGRAIVAAADGPVTVWQVVGQKRLFGLAPHKGPAICLQVSADGSRLATGGEDHTATVYDLTGRKELARFAGHAGPVTGVAWLPDGQHVVTTSTDGTARVWSVETGRAVRWLNQLDARGESVAADADGKFGYIGTVAGTVLRVPLPARKAAAEIAVAKPPADPLPVPSALAVRVARATLPESGGRPDTALTRAHGEGVTPAARYALFREAQRRAVQADSPDLAAQAAIGLGQWFDVDDLGELADTLAQFQKTAQAAVIAEIALDAVERAEAVQRPEAAARFLRLARGLPNLPAGITNGILAAEARLDAAATEVTRIRAAIATLKANPDEPEANLVYGSYLCLARQHWSLGLPYLARCADAGLKDLARADLKAPPDAAGQLRVADGWYARAVAAGDSRARRAFLGRARFWFDRVVAAKADGPGAATARTRLADVDKLDLTPADPTVPAPLTPAVVRRGYESLAGPVRAAEWATEGDVVLTPEGARLGTGDPALRSLFHLMPGSRIVFSIAPDGRDFRVICAGQDVTVSPGAARAVRLTVEFAGDQLQVAVAADGGGPVVRAVAVPPANRDSVAVALRLTGAAAPGGAIVSSAVVRGPVQPAVPKPE